jgi:hypothetical protein
MEEEITAPGVMEDRAMEDRVAERHERMADERRVQQQLTDSHRNTAEPLVGNAPRSDFFREQRLVDEREGAVPGDSRREMARAHDEEHVREFAATKDLPEHSAPERHEPLVESHITAEAAIRILTAPRAGQERMETANRDGESSRERGGEDIQIHIGRIEVIAVPPAPRAAAATPRHAMSLDDYLKRRDGRAR